MEQENISSEIEQQIKNHFLDLFSKKGFSPKNNFDLNVWFMKNFDENFDPREFINRIMSVTPTENSDIVKNLIMKIYLKSNSKALSINVGEFVDEIVENYLNFKNEHSRIIKLIRDYDAFETKSKLEYFINQNLKSINFDDEFSSSFKAYLVEVKNIPKTDLQVSLMAGFSNFNSSNFKLKREKERYSLKDSALNNSQFSTNNSLTQPSRAEQIYEYRLNHILKNSEFSKIDFSYDNEYSFPNIEFYAFENTEQLAKFDSGTNFLYFFLKSENLNNEYDEVLLSEKKPFLDLFIANIKNIINNPFEKHKVFPLELKLKNDIYNMEFVLKIIIELDTNTQSSVFSKIVAILQNIISFKIYVDEKIKTIYDYFPEIAKEIDDEFHQRKENKGCFIF